MELPNVPLAVDVIASGIHDAKNNMFDALARIGSAIRTIRDGQGEAALPILTETEQAVLASAERLSKLLSAYRLTRHENPVSLLPVNVNDLLEDAVLRIAPHRRADLAIESHCEADGFWVCDRELVTDCVVNAMQNALRFAQRKIRIEAAISNDHLELTVADDGPGRRRGDHGKYGRGVRGLGSEQGRGGRRGQRLPPDRLHPGGFPLAVRAVHAEYLDNDDVGLDFRYPKLLFLAQAEVVTVRRVLGSRENDIGQRPALNGRFSRRQAPGRQNSDKHPDNQRYNRCAHGRSSSEPISRATG